MSGPSMTGMIIEMELILTHYLSFFLLLCTLLCLLICLLIMGLPPIRHLALIWARFWCAVILAAYLHKPWRVARDRARREIY